MVPAHTLFLRAARSSGRPYWEVARRSYRRFSTYRVATAAGIFTNTVFAFLKAYVLIAVIGGTERTTRIDAGERSRPPGEIG
jgi:ABC-type uncharacterized transport system permease subunit